MLELQLSNVVYLEGKKGVNKLNAFFFSGPSKQKKNLDILALFSLNRTLDKSQNSLSQKKLASQKKNITETNIGGINNS